MILITDIVAVLLIVLVATLAGLGVVLQVELLEPGVQVFHQSARQDTEWVLYAPLPPGQSPDGAGFSTYSVLHVMLSGVLPFLLAILAALVSGHRWLIRASALLMLLWLISLAHVASYVLLDRNFGTAFFDPAREGGSFDPLVPGLFSQQLRPSIWHLPIAIPWSSPAASGSMGIQDHLVAWTSFALVLTPLVALILLAVATFRSGPGPLRRWALFGMGLALLSTLVPAGPLHGTQFGTLLGHLGLGALGLYVFGFLLLRWLDIQGRSLPRWLVLGFAITSAALLVPALALQLSLGRQGMPTRYVDYPLVFAPANMWNGVFMLALAAVLLVFFAAVLIRRLRAVRPDEVSEIF